MSSKALKRAKEVLVIVHDAGGAEVIGAYVRKHAKRRKFIAYGAGPARDIFQRLRIPIRRVGDSLSELAEIMEKQQNVAFALIAAKGWMSDTETNALKAAKRAGIKTIVYMDSWTGERERFGYPKAGWRAALPDELWAGDRYVLDRLKRYFPQSRLRFVRNQYFEDVRRRFGTLRRHARPDTILFMSVVAKEGEALLRGIVEALGPGGPPICIRLHPADPSSRYDHLIVRTRHVRIERSREKDIVKEIARARIVVGVQNMGLAIAAVCGVRTVCFIPNNMPDLLPLPGILRTRSIRAAALLTKRNALS